MKTPQDPVLPSPAAAANPQPAQPAARGWTVKFLVPPPHTMPTQRMQARADLLRKALSSDNCYQY